MANRNYAQINCTFTSSRKLRGLPTNEDKWVYICCHLSELGNYTGLFRYPLSVWADDVQMTRDEFEVCIGNLVGADLIEYDSNEQLVRIVGWFHKKNAPENASRVIGLITDYRSRDCSNTGMFLHSIAEFCIGSLRRAQGWNPNSLDWPKLRENLGQFLKQTYQEHETDLLAALNNECKGGGKAVEKELQSLLPLMIDFKSKLEINPNGHRRGKLATPCQQGGDTVGAHEHETKRDGYENGNEYENENDTGMVKIENPAKAIGVELLRTGKKPDAGYPKPLAETINSKLAKGETCP